MKFLIFLGNPGPQYEYTRHNIGSLIGDELAKTGNCPARSLDKQSKALDNLKLLGLNESGLNTHPLVARGDEYFWSQSEILIEEYKKRDEILFEELHRRFIELIGGVYINEVQANSIP